MNMFGLTFYDYISPPVFYNWTINNNGDRPRITYDYKLIKITGIVGKIFTKISCLNLHNVQRQRNNLRRETAIRQNYARM